MEMKKAFNSFINIINTAKDRISELNDNSINYPSWNTKKMSVWGEKSEILKLWNYVKCSNICLIVILEDRKGKKYGKIMSENFQN